MTNPLSLSVLFAALREAGLRVSILEVERLQQVLALEPELTGAKAEDTNTRECLKSLLSAILVKRQEEQITFNKVYAKWLADAEEEQQYLTRGSDSGISHVEHSPRSVDKGSPTLAKKEQQPRDRVPSVDGSSSISTELNAWIRRYWRILSLIALALLSIVVAVIIFLLSVESNPPPISQSATSARSNAIRPSKDPQDLHQFSFQTQVPDLKVIPAKPSWTGWLYLCLGLLVLVPTGSIWLLFKSELHFWLHRWRLPGPAPEPQGKGPPRVFPQPLLLSGPQLLDAFQQDMLVWGIGRFMSDEPTRYLDLQATVAATARQGGRPVLHFQRASYQHQVWLWLDQTAEDSTIARYADEVENILKVHSLEMERATFWGIPDQLRTPLGMVFAPREIEERRDVAFVWVLTDGRMLKRQYLIDNRRARIDAVLRDLSYWPHLVFVDFSTDGQALVEILEKHRLERITPTELPVFLWSGNPVLRPAYVDQNYAAWAAACALAPTSVDEATALELRRQLGPVISPWALRTLRAEAPGPAGRLQWPPDLRARRLNWLLDAEAADAAGNIAPGSLLSKALDFWESLYDQELQRRLNSCPSWQDEPAKQHSEMELNLLRLWHKPDQAILKLYQLYQVQRFKDPIQEALGQMKPRSWGATERIRLYFYRCLAWLIGNYSTAVWIFSTRHWGAKEWIRLHLSRCLAWLKAIIQEEPEHLPRNSDATERIRLPWSWAKRSSREKMMLKKMGFGGNIRTSRLRRPELLWLGLIVCSVFAVSALMAAFRSPWIAPTGAPQVEHAEKWPTDARYWTDSTPAGWQLSITTPAWHKEVMVPNAARVQVDWKAESRPCIDVIDNDKSELWRCGTIKNPRRMSSTIQRSLVVLLTPPGVKEAEELATALLDGGSADVVLLDPDWPQHREKLLGNQTQIRPEQQLLIIGIGKHAIPIGEAMLAGEHSTWLETDNWTKLTEDLRSFRNLQTVAKAWPGLDIVAGNPDASQVHGIGVCQPQEIKDDRSNMVFTLLCPGTFRMGSIEGAEAPIHEVTVNAFEISKYEVTNAQFQQFSPNYKGYWSKKDAPASNVSWNDAKAFCEHYGYRLPTEAEWEYAARADTSTDWSFGDNHEDLSQYAWYSGNSSYNAHSVGGKNPNPWGLHDMHGNVWEWVQDCWHDNYIGAPSDSSAWESGECTQRVLRHPITHNCQLIV